MADPAAADRGRAGRRGDAGLDWLWLLPAAVAPVWFGSNTAVVWGAHAVVFGVALAACGAARAFAGTPMPVPLRRLALPLAALAIVLLWAAIQAEPWTPSAWHNPVWGMAAPVVGADLPGAVSVYPEAGRVAMLWTATAAAVFLLAVQSGRDPARARTILRVVALAGSGVAAYGLFAYAAGNGSLLWRPKVYYLDRLTATFVNPDNFAAYAGLVLVCWLGLAADATLPRRPRAALSLALSAAGFLVVGAALFLTDSRAGVAASGLGLGVLSLLLLARASGGRGVVLLLLGLGAAALVGFAAEFGHGLSIRLSRLDPDFAGRLALDARVLAAIHDRPWLGYGYGAFERAFTMFRDWSLPSHNRIQYAHNDWLEAVMVLGIPAGLMLWLIFGWILLRCLIGALGRGRERVFPAVAASACVLATAHSLIDFDLQIQGFALPLLAILGVGVAQSWACGRDAAAAAASAPVGRRRGSGGGGSPLVDTPAGSQIGPGLPISTTCPGPIPTPRRATG